MQQHRKLAELNSSNFENIYRSKVIAAYNYTYVADEVFKLYESGEYAVWR